MKYFIAILAIILLPALLAAQRTVTFDPERDTIAHRLPNGDLQLSIPSKAFTTSLEQGYPSITGISEVYFKKIGKSNYIIARGKKKNNEQINITMAVLLVEVKPGSFQPDNLVSSCESSGGCSLCSDPPACGCNNAQAPGGSCAGSTSMQSTMTKVTVTVFD
jgi:hypothetical protein